MNKTLVCLHWHFVIDFLYKHLQPPPLPPSISCLLEASAVKCQLISSIGSLIDMRPAIGCWSIHELVDYWQSVDQVSVDQVLIKMLIECWLSINWLLIKGRLKVDWWYQSTLHYGCLLLIWSMHSKQLFCHHWFTKVKIPQLKNLPLKVCASLMSFSLTAPTLLDSTFKVIFFDLYVAMASLMASIEPSTSPKWPRKKCLISEYLQCPEN